FTGMEIGILLTGMLVAFIVSVFSIHFLMNYVKKHDFKIFGWYRIVLGIVVLCYFYLIR
ncbi:MAG: undecaprenyl-diphosphate phosphatase, partial [Ruthenibacterium sp.]